MPEPVAGVIDGSAIFPRGRPTPHVQDRFWAAVAAASVRDPGLCGAGVGVSAARAAAGVLGGQAASVTVSGDPLLRLCWGVSDEGGAVAEQLDFTAGEGPCTAAHTGGGLMVAAQRRISWSWPGFAALLTARTSFRSAIVVPLAELGPVAVLTVYYDDPQGCWSADLDAAAVVAGQIAAEVGAQVTVGSAEGTDGFGLEGGSWPWPVDERREAVPIAVGMVMAARSVDPDEAMMLLRAHAFATAVTIDDVADDLVQGRVDVRTWATRPDGRFDG